MQQFTAQYPSAANLLTVWDHDKHLSFDVFQSLSYPETFLIDCQQQVVDKVIGAEENWQQRLAPILTRCSQ
jgi:hypothetical protein